MPELNLITLKCSNCSASLELSDRLERFICNYCGTEQLLVHDSAGFFFKKFEEKMQSLEKATEKGNAELALKRLREDHEIKIRQFNAIHEEKTDSLLLLKNKKELSITTIVVAAFFQAIVLKAELAFSIYFSFQLAILVTLLYQMHCLGNFKKANEEIISKYRPLLEPVADEIKTIEIKIKNKIKFIES